MNHGPGAPGGGRTGRAARVRRGEDQEEGVGKLEDRIVIVTGAASGIGEACARRFAEEGARVVVADVQEEAGEKLAQAIGGRFVRTDVSRPADVEALVAATRDAFGRIDAIMNNAGIDGDQATTGSSSLENWDRVMSINMNGVYYGMKYVLPVMIEQRGGVILNTGSTAGLNGLPGLPAYSASKAGVVHLTKAVAVENAAWGIRANAICPGTVDTPLVRHFIANSPNPEAMRKAMENMNPLPGMVTREAVANAALFLVSDDSAFISGVALPIDGAYTAR
jgi:NAD(P)-dependent dehydrogenase (short-subunit alcohol dehydrogenase family)